MLIFTYAQVFLAEEAPTADAQNISELTGKHRLREFYENKVYTADCGCLTLDLKLGDTRLFAYEH